MHGQGFSVADLRFSGILISLLALNTVMSTAASLSKGAKYRPYAVSVSKILQIPRPAASWYTAQVARYGYSAAEKRGSGLRKLRALCATWMAKLFRLCQPLCVARPWRKRRRLHFSSAQNFRSSGLLDLRLDRLLHVLDVVAVAPLAGAHSLTEVLSVHLFRSRNRQTCFLSMSSGGPR